MTYKTGVQGQRVKNGKRRQIDGIEKGREKKLPVTKRTSFLPSFLFSKGKVSANRLKSGYNWEMVVT